MAILAIKTEPEEILRKRSQEVAEINKIEKDFLSDMLATMYDSKGVGLAAVQVGVLKRMIVIDLQEDDDEKDRKTNFFPLMMVNPRILVSSEENVVMTEGCLSLPAQAVDVARPEKIKLSFLNAMTSTNSEEILEATGWLARVIQHEMDHLDGKLMIDYLTPLKKDMALRRLAKMKKRCIL